MAPALVLRLLLFLTVLAIPRVQGQNPCGTSAPSAPLVPAASPCTTIAPPPTTVTSATCQSFVCPVGMLKANDNIACGQSNYANGVSLGAGGCTAQICCLTITTTTSTSSTITSTTASTTTLPNCASFTCQGGSRGWPDPRSIVCRQNNQVAPCTQAFCCFTTITTTTLTSTTSSSTTTSTTSTLPTCGGFPMSCPVGFTAYPDAATRKCTKHGKPAPCSVNTCCFTTTTTTTPQTCYGYACPSYAFPVQNAATTQCKNGKHLVPCTVDICCYTTTTTTTAKTCYGYQCLPGSLPDPNIATKACTSGGKSVPCTQSICCFTTTTTTTPLNCASFVCPMNMFPDPNPASRVCKKGKNLVACAPDICCFTTTTTSTTSTTTSTTTTPKTCNAFVCPFGSSPYPKSGTRVCKQNGQLVACSVDTCCFTTTTTTTAANCANFVCPFASFPIKNQAHKVCETGGTKVPCSVNICCYTTTTTTTTTSTTTTPMTCGYFICPFGSSPLVDPFGQVCKKGNKTCACTKEICCVTTTTTTSTTTSTKTTTTSTTTILTCAFYVCPVQMVQKPLPQNHMCLASQTANKTFHQIHCTASVCCSVITTTPIPTTIPQFTCMSYHCIANTVKKPQPWTRGCVNGQKAGCNQALCCLQVTTTPCTTTIRYTTPTPYPTTVGVNPCATNAPPAKILYSATQRGASNKAKVVAFSDSRRQPGVLTMVTMPSLGAFAVLMLLGFLAIRLSLRRNRTLQSRQIAPVEHPLSSSQEDSPLLCDRFLEQDALDLQEARRCIDSEEDHYSL